MSCSCQFGQFSSIKEDYAQLFEARTFAPKGRWSLDLADFAQQSCETGSVYVDAEVLSWNGCKLHSWAWSIEHSLCEKLGSIELGYLDLIVEDLAGRKKEAKGIGKFLLIWQSF